MKRKLLNFISAVLIYVVVRLLLATYRITWENMKYREEAAKLSPNGVVLVAIWHEHLFASVLAHRNQNFCPLASLSDDGEIISYVLTWIGYHMIRGSSSRGGIKARENMIAALKEGRNASITVDGPRGPRREPKHGIFSIASQVGIPVVPLSGLSDRYWQLSSWDRFQLPKPFAKITMLYHPLIHVPVNAKREDYQIAAEDLKEKLKQL